MVWTVREEVGSANVMWREYVGKEDQVCALEVVGAIQTQTVDRGQRFTQATQVRKEHLREEATAMEADSKPNCKLYSRTPGMFTVELVDELSRANQLQPEGEVYWGG